MSDFNDNTDLNEWALELKKIKDSKNHATVTRLLAASLMVNPYQTVGEFFKNISDDDLQILLEKSEDLSEQGEGAEDILLIAMMLSQAEGSPAETLDQLHEYVGAFCVLTAGTSLARKGLVKAFYSNMSFGKDMQEAKIFQRL